MPRAIAHVTRSESSSRSSSRNGRRKTSDKPTPSTNIAGVTNTRPTNGSIPKWLNNV